MSKLAWTLIITGLIGFLICFGGFVAVSQADQAEYEICVNRCYLDLPDLDNCIKDEKAYWDNANASDAQFKQSCKHMIKSEKTDCQIDCVVKQIHFVDNP